MIIDRKICPAGLKNNPGRPLKSVDYITIHGTGNYSATATAKSHANYQYGGSGGAQTSWHYTVDKDEIWQSFKDMQECWHAGDGNGPGNTASVGIEICVNDKAGFKKACDNAAWLTAELLKRHGLSIDRVVQHNNWSRKDCPLELRSGAWGMTWDDFITVVKQYSNAAPTGVPIIGPATATVAQMKAWAESKNAAPFFVDLAETFYLASVAAGINPVVVYTQAAKETGYGRFDGVLDASYCNPCGLKTNAGGGDKDASTHMKFASWVEGIQAHVDHLALYAGAAGYPKVSTPDPRHFPYLAGTGKTVEAMAAGWCPGDPDYAAALLPMMCELEAVAVVVEEPEREIAEAAIDLICQKCGFNSPVYWKKVAKDLPYFPEFVIGIANALA